MKNLDLGYGPVMGTLLRMSMPAIGMMLLNTLIHLVDTIFVSWLGEEPMTAVSLSFPVFLVFFALLEGVGAGATALVGQSLGRGNRRGAQLVAISAVALAYVVCLLSIPFFFRGASMAIFNSLGANGNPAILDSAYRYGFWLPITAPFIAFTFIANCVFRCQGDTVSPLVCMATANIVNGVLDPILIFLLGMGVEGAAVATFIGRACASVYVYRKMWGPRGATGLLVPVTPRLRRGLTRYWRQIASIGIPVTLSSATGAIGFGWVNKILAGFGHYAVTAMMIGLRIEDFASTVVISGVSQALTPFLAFNYGRRDLPRMLKGIASALVICGAFMAVAATALFIFPHPFIALFKPSAKAADLAVLYIRAIILSYPFATVQVLLGAFFVATGRSLYGTVAQLVRSILVRVPLAMLFAALFGERGVWWFLPFSWIAGCAVAWYFARRLIGRIRAKTG